MLTSAVDIAETSSIPLTSSSLIPSRSALSNSPDPLIFFDDFSSPSSPICRSFIASPANLSVSPSTSFCTTIFSQSRTSVFTSAVSSFSSCTSPSYALSSAMSSANVESSVHAIAIPFTSTTAMNTASLPSSLSTAPFSSLHGLLSRSSVAPPPSTFGISCNSSTSAVSTCFPASSVSPSLAGVTDTTFSSEPMLSELHPFQPGQTSCSSPVPSTTTVASVFNAPSLNPGSRKRRRPGTCTKQRELPGICIMVLFSYYYLFMFFSASYAL